MMPRSSLFPLAFLALLSLVVAQTPCPDQCECSESELKCVGSRLSAVPQLLTTNVQIIDLRNNSLRDISREDFGIYSSVHVIDLSGNNLERLDDGAFERCSSLMKLQLGGNKLQSLFQETFSGLNSLTSLNLTGNVLREIFRALNLKRLRELYGGFNQLEEIDEDSLRGVHNLRILDLRNNLISRIHPRAFYPLKHLRFLILKNNPLRSAASNLDLSQNGWLHILDLTNCKIETELTNLPKRLRDVRLAHNNMTNITSMFKEARYVDLIILNDNRLVYIDPAALSSLPYLRELWLNHNFLEKIPSLPKHIRAVHVDDNAIDTVDSRSFKVTPHIEIISLQNNKITRLPSESFRNLGLRMVDVSMNEIAVLQRYTFSNLPVLYSVDLSRNPIQRLDVRSFDNVTNLHWLQMARTKVDIVEVESLEMLHMMKKLQYLDLSSSPGVASKLIASGVVLEEVRTLNLMFNDLRTLPSTFPKQFPNIRLLQLSGNKWHCNASLSWLPDYILENDQLFFAKSHIVCYTPLKWRGRGVFTLTVNEMNEVTGPPVIDVEPCPECAEPCDTDNGEAEVVNTEKPEIVENGGNAEGNGEGDGTLGPEPAELQQADDRQTTRNVKVVKFRGKILMKTTVMPETEKITMMPETKNHGAVSEMETHEGTGPSVPAHSDNGQVEKLQSLSLNAGHRASETATGESLVVPTNEETGVETAEETAQKSEQIGAKATSDSAEAVAVPVEPAVGGIALSDAPVDAKLKSKTATESPSVTADVKTTTENVEIKKQRERDAVVWSMMQRMFKF